MSWSVIQSEIVIGSVLFSCPPIAQTVNFDSSIRLPLAAQGLLLLRLNSAGLKEVSIVTGRALATLLVLLENLGRASVTHGQPLSLTRSFKGC